MTILLALAGVVTALVGLVLFVLGVVVADAGRGGYGHGPLPFVKLRVMWELVGLGAVLMVLGALAMLAGVSVVGEVAA